MRRRPRAHAPAPLPGALRPRAGRAPRSLARTHARPRGPSPPPSAVPVAPGTRFAAEEAAGLPQRFGSHSLPVACGVPKLRQCPAGGSRGGICLCVIPEELFRKEENGTFTALSGEMRVRLRESMAKGGGRTAGGRAAGWRWDWSPREAWGMPPGKLPFGPESSRKVSPTRSRHHPRSRCFLGGMARLSGVGGGGELIQE